jgi:hypothetical protein
MNLRLAWVPAVQDSQPVVPLAEDTLAGSVSIAWAGGPGVLAGQIYEFSEVRFIKSKPWLVDVTGQGFVCFT